MVAATHPASYSIGTDEKRHDARKLSAALRVKQGRAFPSPISTQAQLLSTSTDERHAERVRVRP